MQKSVNKHSYTLVLANNKNTHTKRMPTQTKQAAVKKKHTKKCLDPNAKQTVPNHSTHSPACQSRQQ